MRCGRSSGATSLRKPRLNRAADRHCPSSPARALARGVAPLAGVVGVAGLKVEMGVGDDHVAFGDDVLDIQSQAGILAAQPAHEADEGLGAVGGVRVVLNVTGAEMVRDGLLRVSAESGLVVVDYHLLVALKVSHGSPW